MLKRKCQVACFARCTLETRFGKSRMEPTGLLAYLCFPHVSLAAKEGTRGAAQEHGEAHPATQAFFVGLKLVLPELALNWSCS